MKISPSKVIPSKCIECEMDFRIENKKYDFHFPVDFFKSPVVLLSNGLWLNEFFQNTKATTKLMCQSYTISIAIYFFFYFELCFDSLRPKWNGQNDSRFVCWSQYSPNIQWFVKFGEIFVEQEHQRILLYAFQWHNNDLHSSECCLSHHKFEECNTYVPFRPFNYKVLFAMNTFSVVWQTTKNRTKKPTKFYVAFYSWALRKWFVAFAVNTIVTDIRNIYIHSIAISTYQLTHTWW